jgi:hypothetical protein
VVADDVADVAMAAGLDEGVGVDIEDSAFEGEFGGDEFGAGAGFGPGGLVFLEVAAMGLRYHPASGWWMAHPIDCMIQLRGWLRGQCALRLAGKKAYLGG